MGNKYLVEITARAKAFSFEGVRLNRFRVDIATRDVTVYDSIAGYYTHCHCLTKSAIRRVIRCAEMNARTNTVQE